MKKYIFFWQDFVGIILNWAYIRKKFYYMIINYKKITDLTSKVLS